MLKGPSGQCHALILDVNLSPASITVKILYESGDLQIPQGTIVADWYSEFEPPMPGIDKGQIDIGQGRRDILVESLKGIGLGSFLMSIIVDWAKTLPSVPVATIHLSADDASSPAERERRNRFWEKMGFRFAYNEDESWGDSEPMMSHELISPTSQQVNGWLITRV